MFNSVKFGKKIKNIRGLKRLTAYQVSQELHINADYLRKIESGNRTPSIAMFVSILNYYKITAEDYYLDTKLNAEKQLSFANTEYRFFYETLLNHIASKSTIKD